MALSNVFFVYLFLPILLIAYFAVKSNAWRKGVLILFSLVFYAWGQPVYVLLLLFSVVINYLFGLLISYGNTPARKKFAVFLGIIINLAVLGGFKYTGFAADTLNGVLGLSIPVPEIAFPVGISFYTFQALTYLIDLYRENCNVQKRFSSFMLYMTFFPKLTMGPIVRYADLESQLESRRVSAAQFNDGLYRFAIGLAKKTVLSNTCALAKDNLFAITAGPTVLSSWAGILFYAFQIYFDFSGYSDMAVGLGKLFGFDITENFDYPYISKNVTEYWRRWHITLGSSIRHYLFYPVMRSSFVTKLGKFLRKNGYKSAAKNVPTIIALSVVWFSTGLWHGASWNFVLWGVYYGIWIITEKFVFEKLFKKMPSLAASVIQRVSFVFITLFGYAIFYFETDLFKNLGYMFGIGTTGFMNVYADSMIYENGILLIIAAVCCTPLSKIIMDKLRSVSAKLVGADNAYIADRIFKAVIIIALIALSTTRMAGDSYDASIYERF